MYRKRLLAGLLASIMILSCTACGSGGSGSGEQGSSDGATVNDSTVTIAVSSDITTLDPQNALGTVTATMFFNMFDSLTRTNSAGEVECLLAESYENLDDTTWQFKLRQGVTFTNGEAFNADTVKFSVERITSEDYGSSLMSDFSDIDSVEVVDEYTVNIITKTPLPQPASEAHLSGHGSGTVHYGKRRRVFRGQPGGHRCIQTGLLCRRQPAGFGSQRGLFPRCA